MSRLLPILSPSAIYPRFRVQLLRLESSFVTLDNVSDVIDLFWKETGRLNARQTAVCLAADAFSINPDRTYLKAQNSNNAVLIYCQPLDGNFKHFHLHGLPHELGRTIDEIQSAIDDVVTMPTRHEHNVKYLALDNDFEFFGEFLSGGRICSWADGILTVGRSTCE
jgi:hypothetical protein